MSPTVAAAAGLIVAMASSPVLQGVPKKAVEGLAGLGSVRRFRRGTYIAHQGDPSPEVYFLVDGRIEISSFSPTGARILHASVDTPQFLGELGCSGTSPRRRPADAEDTDVWTTPARTSSSSSRASRRPPANSWRPSRGRSRSTRRSPTICCTSI
jgi:CRP-like cAMP-binding protein